LAVNESLQSPQDMVSEWTSFLRLGLGSSQAFYQMFTLAAVCTEEMAPYHIRISFCWCSYYRKIFNLSNTHQLTC